jgi:hypothetical protein
MISILSLISFVAGAQNIEEIVKKADEKMRGNSSQGEFTMIIERPTWSREISMKNWTLGNDYSLVYISAPAKRDVELGSKHRTHDKNSTIDDDAIVAGFRFYQR